MEAAFLNLIIWFAMIALLFRVLSDNGVPFLQRNIWKVVVIGFLSFSLMVL